MAESISLQAGEYYVYTNKNVGGSVITAIESFISNNTGNNGLTVSPNPISREAIVKYQLKTAGNISLDIWSLEGKRLKVLVNGFRAKGNYQVAITKQELSNNKLPVGMYLLRLTENGNQQTKSFLITE